MFLRAVTIATRSSSFVYRAFATKSISINVDGSSHLSNFELFREKGGSDSDMNSLKERLVHTAHHQGIELSWENEGEAGYQLCEVTSGRGLDYDEIRNWVEASGWKVDNIYGVLFDEDNRGM